MFSLWYALLSWKEYKRNLLATKQNKQNPIEEPNLTSEVPKVKLEPVHPADSNDNKTPLTKVPKMMYNSTPTFSPSSHNSIIETCFADGPIKPPPKPPRSPSPHPMKESESFDDIEFDTEDSEEEEDEQNSVIDSTVIEQKRVTSNVEEFLTGEINNIEKDST